MPLLYNELRKSVLWELANEKSVEKLQATMVVREAYLRRLVDVEKS